MKGYRDYLHPIVGLILGYNFISLFEGFNFPIWQQFIVVTIFVGIFVGLCATLYELFEQKYAEATPSDKDIITSVIGGVLGAYLFIFFGELVVLQYAFYPMIIGVFYDMYKMIKK